MRIIGQTVGGNRVTVAPMWILAGQSNCGRALASGLPASLQATQVGSKIFNPYTGKFEDVVAGVNTNLLGAGAGGEFGPEVTFLKAMVEHTGIPQYMVKLGWGSTFLDDQPGTQNQNWFPTVNNATNTLFPRLKTMIQSARAAVPVGLTIEFKGMHWMQGEEDATLLASALAYQVNLQDFIAAMRTFLGVPTLPFIISRINGSGDPAETERTTVRTAEETVGGQAHNYWIDTDAYPLKLDNVHYDHNGQRQHGLDVFEIAKDF